MRKHSITLLLACIFVMQQSIAQVTITKENHSFTAGYRLQFLHVAFPKDYYLEEEHLWDFFRMQSLEKVTSQRYFKTGDSCLHRMACMEGDTRYYYDIHGDTLLMSGYESPLIKRNQGDRFLIPGAINNECVAFSIIEIEKLCKENTECKAEQAYVRNQKPVPLIPTL